MGLGLLLVYLVIFCVVVWAARALLDAFAIPDPIRTVVWVLIVILAIYALLGQFGVIGSGAPIIRLR